MLFSKITAELNNKFLSIVSEWKDEIMNYW